MWLIDLADAARTSGLPVVESPGWRTRGHGPMSGVRTVVCHHTAGPRTGEIPSLGTVRDGRPGLEGPLSQLMLARSGTVHVIAAGLSYHAGVVFDQASESNDWAIGIEAEATGVDPWPTQQYHAYARLCAALVRWYRLPPTRVLGHKEVARPLGRKVDPNFDMAPFRGLVTDYLNGDDMDWNDPLKSPVSGVGDASAATWLTWANVKAGDASHNAALALEAVEALRAELGTGTGSGVVIDYDRLAAAVVASLIAKLRG